LAILHFLQHGEDVRRSLLALDLGKAGPRPGGALAGSEECVQQMSAVREVLFRLPGVVRRAVSLLPHKELAPAAHNMHRQERLDGPLPLAPIAVGV
jgi:hypothetical protein